MHEGIRVFNHTLAVIMAFSLILCALPRQIMQVKEFGELINKESTTKNMVY